MKRLTGIILAALIVGVSLPAWAKENSTIGNLIKMHKEGDAEGKQLIEGYIGAFADGANWANIKLQGQSRPRLYCPPDNLAITNNQSFSIFLEAVEKYNGEGKPSSMRGWFIFQGLIEAFPCE